MAAAVKAVDRQSTHRWMRWLALLAVIVLAAVCYVGIKIGLADAPPLVFGGLRALIAGVVLLAIGASLRAPWRPARRDAWPLALLALTATTATYGAMFASPTQMGAGLASVLGNVQPLLVLVLGALVLRERLTRGKGLALAAGLVGVGLILYPAITASVGGRGSAVGASLALGASAGAAVGSVVVKRIRARPGLVALTGWQLVIGSVPLLITAALQPGGLAIRWTPTFTLVLLFLALLGTALPTTLWFWLLQDEDAGRLSMFLFLIPVLGLGLGAVAFGERIGVLEGTGVLVIVLGLAAVSREAWRGPPRDRLVGQPEAPHRDRHGA
jgi:drug/metabolite transporter (DMT)-like permease